MESIVLPNVPSPMSKVKNILSSTLSGRGLLPVIPGSADEITIASTLN